MSTRYAMAEPSWPVWIPTWIPLDPYKDENPFGPKNPPKPKPKPIETNRFGERAIGQLALAGLEILRTGR